MDNKLLDGKAISAEMREELKVRVAALKAKDVVPGLGVLLVGDDPASRSYVTAKEKACEHVGIHSEEVRLPADATRDMILSVVNQYNSDPKINGILVQLPLPDGQMEQDVIAAIDPNKDVDGFTPVNIGRMQLGLPAYLPCTPHGILHMLKRSGHSPAKKHVVVVGRSNIVGRPLANLLTLKNALGNATVTLCHTGTPDIGVHTRQADIIVAAAGRPNTITGEMIPEGAVVIDVGVNRVEDASKPRGYRLVGDVDFDAALPKVAAITPVPGGVGPMTITMLLYNTVLAAEQVLERETAS